MQKTFLLLLISIMMGLSACELPQDEPEFENAFHLSIGFAETDEKVVYNSLLETQDGGFAFLRVPPSNYTPGTSHDDYLLKTDAEGNILWEKGIYVGPAEKVLSPLGALETTSDDGFITIGNTYMMDDQEVCTPVSSSIGPVCDDIFLIKTDDAGNEIWRSYFGLLDGDNQFGLLDKHSVFKKLLSTKDGGYIAVAFLYGSPSGHIIDYMVRFDASGNLVFQKQLDDFDHRFTPTFLHETEEGNIVMGGWVHTNRNDIFMMMVDNMGNLLWSNIRESPSTEDYFPKFAVHPEGGYLVTYSFRPIDSHINQGTWLARLDENGNEIWNKNIIDRLDPVGGIQSITVTQDNHILLAGNYIIENNRSETDDIDLVLIKMTIEGDEVWRKVYGGTHDEHLDGVIQASDGGFVLLGQTESYLPGGTNAYDDDKIPANLFLIKTDASGNAPQLPQNLSTSDLGWRELKKYR